MNHPLPRSISLLFRYHHSYMGKALAPCGIGMGQYFFVMEICHDPGISQDTLARRLLLNKSTITRAVAQLEEAGFVRREANPDDARAWMLYPTRKAEDALPVFFRSLEESTARLTAPLSDGEARQLEDLLSRCAQGLLDRPD